MNNTTIIPVNLRCEYLQNPLGIDVLEPRLGWELKALSPVRGEKQTAYQILVASTPEMLEADSGDLWDSGIVPSRQTHGVVYQGSSLASSQRVWWKVRAWNSAATVSDWSDSAHWSMGLLGRDWAGQSFLYEPGTPWWIGEANPAPFPEDSSHPSPMLRKSFVLEKAVKHASVSVSALGLYELRINGERVGDRLLTPEWTDYRQRLQYQTYDVTELLHEGDNALGAILGQGWYSGRIGLHFAAPGGGNRGFYGRRLRLVLCLDVELIDGEKLRVFSDGTWRYTIDGPIRGSDILDGEIYDATREIAGWDTATFDDSEWSVVEAVPHGPCLVSQPNEPIRVVERLATLAVSEPEPGAYIFDLGQNMVGWCTLALKARAGQEITLRYAEALDAEGRLYTENLRGAPQVDTYIAKGDESAEIFEPYFTYHGFRYVEVRGLENPPKVSDLEGCVVRSSSQRSSRFNCSSPMITRLWENIYWTQGGNLMSSPTDCPQRDERLGWLGDAQVFSQTACFQMDMAAFYTKWLRDIRDAQSVDGRFPEFAPHPFYSANWFTTNAGWADAGVIVPWRVYVNYGDERILAESYESCKRWITFIVSHNPDLLWKRERGAPGEYGDWLNSDTFKLDMFPSTGGAVPKDIYATAFFAHSTELLARMADILGHSVEAAHYTQLAAAIREAFNKAFVSEDGKIEGDTQGGYALALNFDLLPEKLRPLAARHMVEAFKPFDGHLSTGIQTTVRCMLELSRWGYDDLAFELINKTTMPSWGYMVEQGATTIWERWDAIVNGVYQDPGMNSFNHVAIGAVGEWIFKNIAGIRPDEEHPGYEHFVISPKPKGGLAWAEAEYDSIRGKISVSWKVEGEKISLRLGVPVNTSATVYLPMDSESLIVEGNIDLKEAPDVRIVSYAQSEVIVKVGAGDYSFEGGVLGAAGVKSLKRASLTRDIIA